ncbi:DUF4279 domain-containing protein [Flavobacterium sp. I-SCBP12n]|uniref:DUF4279 domain-containing protein n=1 Tax=Flavobacterium pygoscelis TaxID=2893176 RepID=A0A9X2BPV1_9FLAO|nr:DUF4279 domain-containing protein [Flavobacterium pygoscelis]MCK8141821.1 DUF4279 domain-containing protein [Flavobacterium pygoscelis]
MDYHTNIKIVFSIFGSDFNPIDFTESINISPTKFWVEGELIPNNKKNKKREESCWEYSIQSETIYFEEVSEIFYNIFNNKIENINNYLTEVKNVTVKFDIVLELAEEQGVSLFFNRNFLSMVSKLDSEIDVDTYILKD